MNLSALTALSPLDGRYAAKLATLRPIMSEYGYMHRRVQVEVTWFIALSDAGLPEFAPLSSAARDFLLGLVANFSEADAQAIKDEEKVTNHDVKAVEYWIKKQFKGHAELEKAAEFVHFACTSEDINNTSHALQMRAGREVVVSGLNAITAKLRSMAHQFAAVPMLSRTHGQTASPTTVGKEFANVFVRLSQAIEQIEAVQILAKMNGAVGNYNAHLSAYPTHDWEAFSRRVVESAEPVGQRLRQARRLLHHAVELVAAQSAALQALDQLRECGLRRVGAGAADLNGLVDRLGQPQRLGAGVLRRLPCIFADLGQAREKIAGFGQVAVGAQRHLTNALHGVGKLLALAHHELDAALEVAVAVNDVAELLGAGQALLHAEKGQHLRAGRVDLTPNRVEATRNLLRGLRDGGLFQAKAVELTRHAAQLVASMRAVGGDLEFDAFLSHDPEP